MTPDPVTGQEDRPIKRVQQEDADGCGVAVLAMLTGQSYAAVDAEWPLRLTEHWKDSDVKPHMMMDYLWKRGYSLLVIRDRRYAQDCCNRNDPTENHAPGCRGEGWPSIRPFAPMHYAMVDSPTQPTGHWIAIAADGAVLDPFDGSRTTLDAYEKMHEVVGVWPRVLPRPDSRSALRAKASLDGFCVICGQSTQQGESDEAIREALAFYADPAHYERGQSESSEKRMMERVLVDGGGRARIALRAARENRTQ